MSVLNKREWRAFLLAPLIPVVFFVLVFMASGYGFDFFALLISVPFSYVPCFLFCVSVMRILRARGMLTVTSIALCGVVLGAAVFYMFRFFLSAMLGSSADLVPGVSELVWGALLGLSVALPFGLIAGFPFFKLERGVK
jgi:hypothetical protein